MLKMTIDNEEVVSDKDITINEEMLSASSTILNNVYPKEWEEDKDYTSKFYYPQDYSKALIQRSYVTQEAEAGTTIQVNGSVTLTDVDTTKNSRVLRLLGQTSQTGTPTPSNPIPVNVVSGDNEINICGENLFHSDGINLATLSGITSSFDNSSISLNGSNTSAGYVISNRTATNITLEAGTYYFSIFLLSGSINRGSNQGEFTIKTSDGRTGITLSNIINSPSGYTKSFTATEKTTLETDFYLNGAITFTNAVLGIEISKQTPTTYEPYQGNTYNINLPVENLFNKSATPISNASTTMSELDTGVRATVTSAGNNRYSAYKLSNSDSLLGKTLNISATITISGTNNAYIRFYWLNGNTLTSLIAQTINSTGNANFNIPSSYPSGSNGIAILFSSNASGSSSIGDYVDYTNVMLTYDNYKGKYTPYGTTPIELCKIGNYQDYIYKDSDKWYLHKEIGKVVLNGTTTPFNSKHGSIKSDTKGFYQFTLPEKLHTSSSGVTDYGKSNYFELVSGSAQNAFNNNSSGIWWEGNSNYSYVILEQTSLTSANTWLTTHNTEVYYVLATPTNTEITYTPLIEQLNALSSQ